MPSVPDAIHQTKRRDGSKSVGEVVLHDHGGAGRATRFAEERHGIVGVMQDVDEEHDVDGAVGHGQVTAVEAINGYRGAGPSEDVHGADRDVRPRANDLTGDPPVTGAHVEGTCAPGQPWRDPSGEHPCPPAHDRSLVHPLDRPHRRRSPRMLRKKLDNTVW